MLFAGHEEARSRSDARRVGDHSCSCVRCVSMCVVCLVCVGAFLVMDGGEAQAATKVRPWRHPLVGSIGCGPANEGMSEEVERVDRRPPALLSPRTEVIGRTLLRMLSVLSNDARFQPWNRLWVSGASVVGGWRVSGTHVCVHVFNPCAFGTGWCLLMDHVGCLRVH